jgi:hypothetical protein
MYALDGEDERASVPGQLIDGGAQFVQLVWPELLGGIEDFRDAEQDVSSF